VDELLRQGELTRSYADAPLEARWALAVEEALANGPAAWRQPGGLPPVLSQGNWGAPTGQGNQRGTGGPSHGPFLEPFRRETSLSIDFVL
jgi:hypothetical protein